MNIDELTLAIQATSSDPVVQRLAEELTTWKTSEATVEDLLTHSDRFIGQTWIKDDEIHEKVYSMWSAFRKNAIIGIGGMTMNERLYWFGLFEEYDNCPTDACRLGIYHKLLAKP